VKKAKRFSPRKRLLAIAGVAFFGLTATVIGLSQLSDSFAEASECYGTDIQGCISVYAPGATFVKVAENGDKDIYMPSYENGKYVTDFNSYSAVDNYSSDKIFVDGNYWSGIGFDVVGDDAYKYVGFFMDMNGNYIASTSVSEQFPTDEGEKVFGFDFFGDNDLGILPAESNFYFKPVSEIITVDFGDSNYTSGLIAFDYDYVGNIDSGIGGSFRIDRATDYYDYSEVDEEGNEQSVSGKSAHYLSADDFVDNFSLTVQEEFLGVMGYKVSLVDTNSDWSTTLVKKIIEDDIECYVLDASAEVPVGAHLVINTSVDSSYLDAEVKPGEEKYGMLSPEKYGDYTNRYTSVYFYDSVQTSEGEEYYSFWDATISINGFKAIDNFEHNPEGYSTDYQVYVSSDINVPTDENGNAEDPTDIYVDFRTDLDKKFTGFISINGQYYSIPLDYNDRADWEKHKIGDKVGFTLKLSGFEDISRGLTIFYHTEDFTIPMSDFSFREDGGDDLSNAEVSLKKLDCRVGYNLYEDYLDLTNSEARPAGCTVDTSSSDYDISASAGSNYYVTALPKRGYQALKSNDYVNPTEEAGVYMVRADEGSYSLGMEFYAVSDLLESKTKLIPSGSVKVSNNDIEYGSAHLIAKEIEPSDESKEAFAEFAGEDTLLSYFDFSLKNVIYNTKGSRWTLKNLSETSEPVSVKLKLKDGLVDSNVQLLHEAHDGTIEVMDIDFDSESNTISFESDNFSTFALTVLEQPEEEEIIGSEDSAPNTFDGVVKALVVFFSSALILGACVLKK